MAFTIDVSNIASTTTKDQLHDFFTFCGKITSIDYQEKSGKAQIAFERRNAATTALMLNGGALDGSHLSVTSDSVHPDDDLAHPDQPVDPSYRPRAGIAAEYLAKGYVLSEQILQRAIHLDQQRGISKSFLSYFHSLDKTVGEKALGPEQTVSAKVTATVGQATEQAKAFDEQKGISKTLHEYYVKAISSPIGQKVKSFYTDTSKQVLDIHEEARRLAEEEKKSKDSTATVASPDPKAEAA